MIAQKPILHLVLLNLKPAAGKAPVDELLAAFGRLAEIDGVLHLGAARAASDDSTHSQERVTPSPPSSAHLHVHLQGDGQRQRARA